MITRVNCPVCAAKVDWLPTSVFRPFCSERCKRTDLGAWAEEKYVIPVVATNDDENEDAESRQYRD